jgi:hypothetical protein
LPVGSFCRASHPETDVEAILTIVIARGAASSRLLWREPVLELDHAHSGDCALLAVEIGRPSLNEAYNLRPVIGSPRINAFLPVIWFIEPTSGAIQFCAVSHAEACVQLTLPRSPS